MTDSDDLRRRAGLPVKENRLIQSETEQLEMLIVNTLHEAGFKVRTSHNFRDGADIEITGPTGLEYTIRIGASSK